MDSRTNRIAIAISKGRIAKAVTPLLEHAGIAPVEDIGSSRNLLFETLDENVELIVVRSTDVPTYVQMGGADLGVVGKDVLLELQNGGFYELVDLGISKCELVIAQKMRSDTGCGPHRRKLRVATKYVNTTRRHFAAKGVYVDVMHLSGSMELAPSRGLADQIVDLSQTGETLRSNGLVKVESIADISARLIANKAALRLKENLLKDIVSKLEQAAGRRNNES
ncbi:MAG: ATP phosphoribosyltransferase [Acidiferrobacterales bacterium]|nr:ATP phosphoribosyltransferase [Acidiferrobacterales bacterium]